MKIRTRNLILLLPIFIFMAGVWALVTYENIREEYDWGMNQAARTAAISFAEFSSQIYRTRPAPFYNSKRFLDSMQRLKQQKFIKYADIYSLENKHLYHLNVEGFQTEDEPEEPVSDEITANKTAESLLPVISKNKTDVNQKDVLMTSEYMIVNGEHELASMTTITDTRGRAVFYAAITLSADDMYKDLKAIIIKIIITSFATLLFGVIVILLISRYFVSSIHSLNRAASEAAAGNYENKIETSGIKELNDLGNTFNTMTSVLSDTLEKTQRDVLENEQFRSLSEVTRSINETINSDLTYSNDIAEIEMFAIGKKQAGLFIASYVTDNGLIAAAGVIKSDNPMIASTKASSFKTSLEQVFISKGFDPEDIKNLFFMYKPAGLVVLTMINGRIDYYEIKKENENIKIVEKSQTQEAQLITVSDNMQQPGQRAQVIEFLFKVNENKPLKEVKQLLVSNQLEKSALQVILYKIKI